MIWFIGVQAVFYIVLIALMVKAIDKADDIVTLSDVERFKAKCSEGGKSSTIFAILMLVWAIFLIARYF